MKSVLARLYFDSLHLKHPTWQKTLREAQQFKQLLVTVDLLFCDTCVIACKMNVDVENNIRQNNPWSKLPANVKQVLKHISLP